MLHTSSDGPILLFFAIVSAGVALIVTTGVHL
jgi:hypothetical protein